MQDPPTISVIAELARQSAANKPDDKFQARLSTAAFELVERETALAPASDLAEHERLSTLITESGDLTALNRRLCTLIRDGSLTLASPGVAAHLRATTMEKLAIDQPTYAAYRRALEQG